MQELWYGDRRDRVKWGALAYLAGRFRLASILQVAYFRDGGERLLKTDTGEHAIPEPVWKHFADLVAIERLSEILKVEIGVYGEVFDPRKRDEYFNGVLRVAERRSRPRLLFLDPDTGIQPGALKPEHASSNEIARLWRALAGCGKSDGGRAQRVDSGRRGGTTIAPPIHSALHLERARPVSRPHTGCSTSFAIRTRL